MKTTVPTCSPEKAMIVAIDRATGIDIYKKLMELRPQWKDIICVVMTQGNQDPVEWNDIIGSAARKEELARQFKDNNSPLKIAIVVDMWLTGFDVPSLATMYVYKPMKGHNLMQAIARVNRVFPEKERRFSSGLHRHCQGSQKRPCTTIQDVTRKTTATRTSRQPPINSSSPHSSVAGNV